MEKQPPQATAKAIAPVDELCRALDRMVPDFQALLPANVTPEKFIRTLKTAIRTNPKLVACSRQSLFGESMKCAQDGLLPDGREAALVPFGGKSDDSPTAKYMPMVGGICKRARNSGEIVTIDAQTVFEKDTYEAWTDEKGPHFKHTRFRGGDRGKPVLTYAYALTKDGGLYFEEMDATVILAIKKLAIAKAGGKDTPWNGPFEDEQWRKSALHRLCKYRLPSSSDMEGLLEREDDLFDKTKEDEPEKKPESTKPNRTASIIEGQVVKPDEQQAAQQQPPAESSGGDDVEQVPI